VDYTSENPAGTEVNTAFFPQRPGNIFSPIGEPLYYFTGINSGSRKMSKVWMNKANVISFGELKASTIGDMGPVSDIQAWWFLLISFPQF
jgi:hypothetical protein